MKLGSTLTVMCLVLASNPSLAEDVILQDWETFTQPYLVNSERPKMPGAIWREDIEGWVDVEVTVAVDGSAHNPRILATSIDGVFEKATLEAASNWRFEPATVNGKPVETTHEVRQSFFFEDNSDSISQAFARRAQGISRAFADNDLDTAWKKIGQLEEKRTRLMAEGIYMDFFKANYYEKTNQPTLALYHLNRALYMADGYVARAVREHMLRSAVKLNAEQRNFVAALARFEQLEGLVRKLPADDPIRQYAADINAAIASDQPLAWQATLERCDGCARETYSWSHPLVRKRFTLSAVPDTLEDTQLRCDEHFQYFRLRAGETYAIPEGITGCTFHANSWRAERFSLIELPAGG
jgi:TonB family protein